MTRNAGLVLILSLLTACGRASPEVAETATCPPTCRIAVTHVATISDSTNPGLFRSESNQFSWDGIDRIFAAVPGAVVEFDLAGRLVRTIGREGRGPGEYQYPYPPITSDGDSLFVYDFVLKRLSVYDSSRALVDVRDMQLRPDFKTGPHFISAEIGRAPQTMGYAFHVLTGNGAVVRSVGLDSAVGVDRGATSEKALAPTSDGLVWVATRGKFSFDLWNPSTDELVHRVAPQFSKFEPSLANDFEPATERPTSWIISMWADDEAHLWVLSRVADLKWEPRSGPDHVPHSVAIDAQHYDWILAVVDLRSGRILADHRFDKPVRAGWDQRGMLFTLNGEDETGLYYDVLSPSLTPANPPQLEGPPR